MKGSIRVIAGLLGTMGAVGTLEVDPNASVLIQMAIALACLAVMATGVSAMNQKSA